MLISGLVEMWKFASEICSSPISPSPPPPLSAGVMTSFFMKKIEDIWRESLQLSITTSTHLQTSMTNYSIFTSVTTEELFAIQSMETYKSVLLLSFSQTGLQPNMAGDLDFYIKTFDVEMLTTGYFLNKTSISQINKQMKLSSNQRPWLWISCGLLATNINQYIQKHSRTLKGDSQGIPLLPMVG